MVLESTFTLFMPCVDHDRSQRKEELDEELVVVEGLFTGLCRFLGEGLSLYEMSRECSSGVSTVDIK